MADFNNASLEDLHKYLGMLQPKKDEDDDEETTQEASQPASDPLAGLSEQLTDSMPSRAPASTPEPIVESPEPTPVSTIPPLPSTLGTVDNLKHVQQQANNATLMNQLGKASELIGSGIGAAASGGAIHPTERTGSPVYDQNIALAQQGVKDFQALSEQEKKDPNSEYSKNLKQFITPLLPKGINPEIFKSASAEQMNTLVPLAVKMYDVQQSQQTRKEVLQQQLEDKAEKREETKKTQLDRQDTERLDKLAKNISDQLASSRSAFGIDAKNLNSIQNAKTLLNGETNLDNIDTRQMAEVARILDRVLSQGSPTISGTEKLTPDTARMKIAKLLELAGNRRQGAGAGDFLKSMSSTLDREEKIANDRISKTKGQITSSYKDLYDRHPDVVRNIFSKNGLDADLLFGGPTRNPSSQEIQQPEIKVINGITYKKVAGGWEKQ